MYIPKKCALCDKKADQSNFIRSLFGKLICTKCYNVFAELRWIAKGEIDHVDNWAKAKNLYELALKKLLLGENEKSNLEKLFGYAETMWGE